MSGNVRRLSRPRPDPDPNARALARILDRLDAIEQAQAASAVEQATLLERQAAVLAHVDELCAAIVGLGAGVSAELEAVKAGADRLRREVRLLRNRCERIDGRLERAEIAILAVNAHYPETQASLPDDVLAKVRRHLSVGLPATIQEGDTDGR